MATINIRYEGWKLNLDERTHTMMSASHIPYVIDIETIQSFSTKYATLQFKLESDDEWSKEIARLFEIRCSPDKVGWIIQTMVDNPSTPVSAFSFSELISRGSVPHGLVTTIMTQKGSVGVIDMYKESEIKNYAVAMHAPNPSWLKTIRHRIAERFIQLIGPVDKLPDLDGLEHINFIKSNGMVFEVRICKFGERFDQMFSIRIMQPAHRTDFVHIVCHSHDDQKLVRDALELLKSVHTDDGLVTDNLEAMLVEGKESKDMRLPASPADRPIFFTEYRSSKATDPIWIMVPTDKHTDRECNIFESIMQAIGVATDRKNVTMTQPPDPPRPSKPPSASFAQISLCIGIVGLLLIIVRRTYRPTYLIGCIGLIVASAIKIIRSS